MALKFDLEKALKWRREADGFNRYVGLEVKDIWEGGARVELKLRPELLNPIGMAHGGTLFTLCDAAAGSAALSRGTIAVTLNGVINYLYEGRPEESLCAVAEERKYGRRVSVYDVTVTDSTDRCITTATFTMYYTKTTLEDVM